MQQVSVIQETSTRLQDYNTSLQQYNSQMQTDANKAAEALAAA
eukprot:SM012412S25736  [mRNA]  locus=s12412:84:415:+ [translate_table: standard]